MTLTDASSVGPELVELTGSELLVGVLVEGVHDGLVGGVRLGRFGVFFSTDMLIGAPDTTIDTTVERSRTEEDRT
ncbi:hypothetical protein [Streptomyces iconiensis]|uniref:Uncharacterized protein n=1 Tax=Streptomyces iconiensis TaxID=1384038 RepID=A0ABT7A3C6_9ACTN|nr:hypothetical protein [Streptomyces iconiensis]MDJ1135781.1 hypothetical protein [Streptomyces iconiensis]